MFIINEITILVWLVCGIGAFLIAQNRGATNAPTWFLVGVLLGPIGIILAVLGAKGPGRTGASVIGAADELAKLASLRDAGTITAEEFERQKAGLLTAQASEPSAPVSPVFKVVVVVVLLAGGYFLFRIATQ